MLPLLLILFAAAEPPVVAATVNGEEILLGRLDDHIRKLAVIPVSATPSRQLRTDVLNDMVDDLLLKQFLDKNAPKVEDAEIDKMMAAFKASLERKGGTLEKFLQESNQTEAQLRASWTTTAQLDAWVRKTVSEDDLKKYWVENKDHFEGGEVKASHILIRCGAKPLDQAAAKAKLEAIRKDVAAGKLDFAAAAKKHSQCPSAKSGGDIGWFPRKGAMVEEFAKPAFKLKTGEMGFAQTEFGMHLILATDRKAGKPVAFEKCMEAVREAYGDDQRAVLAAKLRKEASIKIMLP